MDIVLLSTPVMETSSPAPAIYYLKGSLVKHGYTAKCFDLVKSMESLGEETLNKVTSILLEDARAGQFASKDDTTLWDIVTNYFTSYIADNIVPLDPTWIAISVFSKNSQKSSRLLCTLFRQLLPNSKIVLGGAGLSRTSGATPEFANELIENNLADYYITGEGELAIVELLNNNINYPGIHYQGHGSQYEQIDDLDTLAYPDYSDYYNSFQSTGKTVITGSRGCVKRCSFCDVGQFWKKYRFRSGEHIARELIYHNEKYGVQEFFFSDSLVNGSMKAFRDLCEILADYHENNPEPHKQLRWEGQFIVRSESQSPFADYEVMYRAGFRRAVIGIESASESVRMHMNKYFSNEDMDFTVDSLLANGIDVSAMFVIGYPSETREDFEENLKWLYKYRDSVPDKAQDGMGAIRMLNLGQTLAMLPGAPINNHSIIDGYHNWVSKVVPGLDLEERVNRRREIGEYALSLGYDIFWQERQMYFLEKRLKEWIAAGRPVD